jgi:hypothetical protein
MQTHEHHFPITAIGQFSAQGISSRMNGMLERMVIISCQSLRILLPTSYSFLLAPDPNSRCHIHVGFPLVPPILPIIEISNFGAMFLLLYGAMVLDSSLIICPVSLSFVMCACFSHAVALTALVALLALHTLRIFVTPAVCSLSVSVIKRVLQ